MILNICFIFTAKKKQGTVFDRLGESSVSSTTSEMSVVSFGSKSTETNGFVSKEKVSLVFLWWQIAVPFFYERFNFFRVYHPCFQGWAEKRLP